MDYTPLEDAYGSPFGQRVPITHTRKDVKEEAPPAFSNLAKRSEEAVAKNKDLVSQIVGTLPLDQDKTTETFRVYEEQPKRLAVRETFGTPLTLGGGGDQDKLDRILRLIEQNRTGYERPAVQDMVLYIATGLFFMFTLDTFVLLGKSMGRRA